MSNITVIGVGSMGSVLAKTMLSAGLAVTVWNRNRERSEPLVSCGAQVAETIEEAIKANPIILVCISNYESTKKLFEEDSSLNALKDRLVIQLSSGTPQEAIDIAHWFQKNGIDYLDGAILGSPSSIGTEDGQILIAGNDGLWDKCKSILECLANNLQHTGTKIDSAKILDLAWLSQRLGTFMGACQGLLLCQASGVEPNVFGKTVAANERVRMMANTIQTNTYSDSISSVKVWKEAFHHVQVQAQKTGTNFEVLDFIADKFQRAYAAGYEEEDLAALIKIFEK